MSPLRVGVVGLGRWGKTVLKVVQELRDDLEVVAVGTNGSLMENLGAQHTCRHYSNYLDVISDLGVDGIIITSPLASHFELVREALKQRLPVFCEKPLVGTVAQVDELTALWEAAERPAFMVNYQHLYNAALVTQLEKLAGLAGGYFVTFEVQHGGPGPERPDCTSFMDYGVHDLAVLNCLWSKPVVREVAQSSDGTTTGVQLSCKDYLLQLDTCNVSEEKVHTWRATVGRPEKVLFNLDLHAPPEGLSPLHLSLKAWSRVARGMAPGAQWHTPMFSRRITEWVVEVELLLKKGRIQQGEKMQ